MDETVLKYFQSLRGKIPDSEIRKEIRLLFEVKKTRSQEIFHEIFGAESQPPKPDKPAVTKTELGDSLNVTVDTEDTFTLDDVIKFCAIDTGKWESHGFSVNKGPNGLRWSARFKKNPNWINPVKLLDEFIARASEHAPRFPVQPIKKCAEKDNLLEIAVPDLHLAKLCWAKETGGRHYDIKIAAEDYKRAVRDLFLRAEGRASRVLLPVGNDMFNSDNLHGTTTAGTPQAVSEDSRWPKLFTIGCNILTETITELASKVHVDVVIVAGNHDKERSFYLGAYLSAWFRNHPNVTINNEPTQRKYYRFGQTLIGFTHGSEEKKAKLPGIMAREQKKAWSECKFYQWHLGHIHHEVTYDYEGVVVRFLPSLCPPDEWHTSKGFIGSVQAAQAFEYHPTNGLMTIHHHNV